MATKYCAQFAVLNPRPCFAPDGATILQGGESQ